ncbi:epidermal growth factor receptor substrate 15-like 1 isoform X2 [Xenia sp. Carnegie-2017]|uniref:epidermal growth factor receptor substrate 15-like 1 isoform X2 n=1 Tax=Xenia sp. Carnegie-2017 TaxID=2897299 RepID=UPI001F03E102|nr:epidermal growth factor receptor substrate 15-like 1 isoform X2 [Xenia sp. Carnegie-2017]
MAAVSSLSLSQLSSGHSTLYENYWKQVDISGSGKINAEEAARFLKRSGLGDAILREIWELSNPTGNSHLDKQGFYVALRLIANAQNGKEVSLLHISLPGPPPNLGEHNVTSLSGDNSGWLIQPAEKSKYDGIFESLTPVNGLLSGDKVKPVLLNSKLHVDILGRVWDLSDIDNDGMLDKDEFSVAMHLVYKALEGEAVPQSLSPSLIPPSKRFFVPDSVSPKKSPGVSPTPIMASTTSSHVSSNVPWVVTPAEKSKYDAMFKTVDKDNDNFVTGDEVKSIFMASGLSQLLLAHIWSLCDVNNSGRLNVEQFCLAMFLIQQKVKGIEPPKTLPPEMVPPSMRAGGQALIIPGAIDEAIKSTASSSMAGELDKISKEIEELGKTKTSLQKEIEENEDLVRRRHIEVQELESELEKAKDEIKQLDKRKEETKQQLDKLDHEKVNFETQLKEIQGKCHDETQKINSLKAQIADEDVAIQKREDELSTARNELNKLRQQETELEKEVQMEKEKLENVQKQVNVVQDEIMQVQTKLKSVKESNDVLNGEINTYNSLLQSGGSVNNQSNSIGIGDFAPISSDGFTDILTTTSEVDTMSIRATAGSSPVSSISGFSVGSGRVDEAVDDFKDKDGADDDKELDPFKSKDDSAHDPFTTNDALKIDPFAPFKTVSFADPFSSDPFEEKDPFGSSGEKSPENGFKSDPFANSDATPNASSDPFSSSSNDPFQASFPSDKSSSDDFFSGDPFKSTTSNSGSVTDPFQSSDFFSGTDLFDGPPNHVDDEKSKSPKSDSFSSSTNISDPFASSNATKSNDPFTASFASFSEPVKQKSETKSTKSDKEIIEWAKRQSKRDEKDRQKKMKSLQDEEEKQLAMALKKSLEESGS